MNEQSTNYLAEPPVTREKESQITSRWLLWQPALIMESRKQPDPTSQMNIYKVTHRSRIIALQSAGITWRVIVKHNLDNPMWGNALFEFQLRAAVRRSVQRARPGVSRKEMIRKLTGEK